MLSDSSFPHSDFDSLASFAGEPGQFWPRLCAHSLRLFDAQGACLILQTHADGVDNVRVLAQDSAKSSQRVSESGLIGALGSMADGALHIWADGILVLALPVLEGPRLWLVILDSLLREPEVAAREVRMIAESYQARRREQRTGEQVMNLSEVLDIGLTLGESTTFTEASLRLCHRLTVMMRAVRVSLGWLENGRLKLSATSHGGRVSSSTQEAESIIRAMEEAADQNNEAAHPVIAGSDAITREHKIFSQNHNGSAVLSVPLRDGAKHEVLGVLLIERDAAESTWGATDLERMRLTADLVAPRLADLQGVSGWWGRRLWRASRKRAAGLIGVEHTGWKLAGLLLVITLVALALIQIDHKVRAPFLLKTEAAAVTAAPFPGYIEEVRYHLGDVVKKGQILVTLDRRELLLDEANGVAGRDKNDREARSYEAQGKLAEALMAKAEEQQDEAKLAIIRHRLGKTEIKAPFDGVVVEGDLRERLSSPVRLGEPLLKIVQLRDLYGQLQVDERDIGYLGEGLKGELAFASRPHEKFGVSVERFEPVAEVHQEGNVFVLRVKIDNAAEDWWRPGMSGVCKITTGRRSLLWVITHRTLETLRLWFWL
ncbi:MAG: putative phytochrome sensor protein [Verrucomicrobiaceae bacterium]|nr:putative phytochrome sensor protein [Verrucomicrobiaceae bacterium]